MDTSIFLAKAMGIYFLVISLVLLIRPKGFDAAVQDLKERPGLLFFTAIVTLVIGILLVLSHNIWVMNWRVIITILCWIVFLKGMLRVFEPSIGMKWAEMICKPKSARIVGIVMLVVSLVLVLFGFFIH